MSIVPPKRQLITSEQNRVYSGRDENNEKLQCSVNKFRRSLICQTRRSLSSELVPCSLKPVCGTDGAATVKPVTNK